MKKITLAAMVLCCAGILAAGLGLFGYFNQAGKQTIYIALAGPMSGFAAEEGKAMLRGVTLAYEQVKREGKLLKNKKVEIIPRDDKDSQSAVHIASDIVRENKVLLVLGHYSSSGSGAASSIYQSNGIPAVTASATRETATLENEWFFRTIPGMRTMTQFVVNSMLELPGVTSKNAAIIYDTSFSDTSVAKKFKENAESIFDDLKLWPFDSNSETRDKDIKEIIGQIRAKQSVGPIFFATESKDSGDIISSFNYPGTDYPIIGLDSLAVPTFIRQFESDPKEQEKPGYYTNGTYAVSPFISYLADQPNALAFREEFFRRYGKEPTWVAAAYYDAMLLALNAIEQAEVQGKDIREDRRNIRNMLNRFDKKDVAVKGVTGDLFFDEDGNINLPMALGVWWNHTFLPAYQQYQRSDSDESNSKQLGGEGAKPTIRLGVVYTGVDINAIRNVDIQEGIFTADFYIWFRFKGTFDDTAITFINAKHPISMKEPIIEEIDSRTGADVRAYRVIADFALTGTTDAYPLDNHTLRISFRHEKETRKELIYIPDVIGMKGSVEKKNRGENMLEAISGWETSEILSKQGLEIVSKGEKEESYSRIDTEISIYREERGISSVQVMLPFIAVIMFCGFLFRLSPDNMRFRLSALILFLSLTLALRTLYGYILPGQDVVRYMVNMVFALLIFSFSVSGIAYYTQKGGHARLAKCILYKGSFFYLAAAITGIVYLLISRSYIPWSWPIDVISAQWESFGWMIEDVKKIHGR